MKVTGERRFEAPRETVWEVLNDPAQMAKTMPGVESFDIQDDRHWRADPKGPPRLRGPGLVVDFVKRAGADPGLTKVHTKGDGGRADKKTGPAVSLIRGGRGR